MVVALKEGDFFCTHKQSRFNTDMLRKLQLWAYDDSAFTQLPLSRKHYLLWSFRSVVLPAGGKWTQKIESSFLVLLLLSLGLFDSLSDLLCVEQAERSS